MAFRRKDDKKGLSLPGLIDIIFLLLVFSLVTLSVSSSQLESEDKGDSQGADLNLPFADAAQTHESSQLLSTLLFQIEHWEPDDPQTPKVLYVLIPEYGDTLSLANAKNRAIVDSMYAYYPSNFLDLNDRQFNRIPPNRMISRYIESYKKEHFYEPGWDNTVEIRASKNIEFRLIQYILNACSAYGDTIPQVVLHTLSGEEINYAVF